MSSIKNPENEAENPATMPAQQGHGGHRAKMAVYKDTPPGLEQDSHGEVIPLAERTPEDQAAALRGTKNQTSE